MVILDLIVSRSPPVMEHQQATQERSPSLSIVYTINTPPVATDQNVSASLNTPLNITLEAQMLNDSLYHSIISQPKKGTLSKIDQNTST